MNAADKRRPNHNRVRAFVGLGSNLGDRFALLQRGLDALAAVPGVDLRAVSSVYETDPHVLDPHESVPPYLNAVVALDTSVPAEALLDHLHRIEAEHGRDRAEIRWAARPLDLDLLVYDDVEHRSAALTLPHPRLGDRLFVLIPLAELAPTLHVPPPFDTTVATLLHDCRDAHKLGLHPAPLHLPDVP